MQSLNDRLSFTKLISWFRQNQRILPWRQTSSPYHIWVSEIMLQQTQVVSVIDYFNRFITAFPTITALAQADQQQVLKLWEGLGYYSRARNLHKAAQFLIEQQKGQLPEHFDELQTIPGIGPYTAAAIASIAFGQAIPVVDGNVLRVSCRFWGIGDDIRLQKTKKQIFDQLFPLIQHFAPSDFNQALMELGALICSPQNPRCSQCPLQEQCFAQKNQQQKSLPFKSKAKARPHYLISVAVIYNPQGQVLIAKRHENQMLGGLWEFPGGKQENDETAEEAAIREVKEETGLEIQVHHLITTIKHAYTHFSISMSAFHCTCKETNPHLITDQETHWVTPSDLSQYPFPKANQNLLPFLT